MDVGECGMVEDMCWGNEEEREGREWALFLVLFLMLVLELVLVLRREEDEGKSD